MSWYMRGSPWLKILWNTFIFKGYKQHGHLPPPNPLYLHTNASPPSILSLPILLPISFGVNLFSPALTLALSYLQHQTPPPPFTSLPIHFSHFYYLSLFTLLYPVAFFFLPQPNPLIPPINYPCLNGILVYPLVKCGKMEDPENIV